MKLKDVLKQSNSVSLTTDAAKIPAEEIAALVQELGIKYTLDDRLDAIATDNGANFLAVVEDLLESGICEEQARGLVSGLSGQLAFGCSAGTFLEQFVRTNVGVVLDQVFFKRSRLSSSHSWSNLSTVPDQCGDDLRGGRY
ncbi:hypothetical protein EMCRGX_G021548 [Ephydatia muelleri]